jgi:hypothetical protein
LIDIAGLQAASHDYYHDHDDNIYDYDNYYDHYYYDHHNNYYYDHHNNYYRGKWLGQIGFGSVVHGCLYHCSRYL